MREIQQISGPRVWHGREMANSPRWRRRIGDGQLAEIDLAVRQARARGLGWQTMTADDFPLPSFSALAEEIRAELENGSGIVLLQGLDASPYSLGELRLLYAAIARQIGTFVYSNRAGEITREIRDVDAAESSPGGIEEARCRPANIPDNTSRLRAPLLWVAGTADRSQTGPDYAFSRAGLRSRRKPTRKAGRPDVSWQHWPNTRLPSAVDAGSNATSPKPGCRPAKPSTGSHATRRWREPDSNPRSLGTASSVVGPCRSLPRGVK
jgi:hypothetical protein